MTFSPISGDFSKVFFGTFFAGAFSTEGRCCRVPHARKPWFLPGFLTIFNFRVFPENLKKMQIPTAIALPKTIENCLNPENDAKNHEKLPENKRNISGK